MLLYYVFKCFIQLIFGCTRGSPKFNAARNFPWRLPLGDHEWLQVQWFIAFNKLLRVKSITQMISNSPYLPWLPSPSNHPKTWCPLHRCTILLRSMVRTKHRLYKTNSAWITKHYEKIINVFNINNLFLKEEPESQIIQKQLRLNDKVEICATPTLSINITPRLAWTENGRRNLFLPIEICSFCDIKDEIRGPTWIQYTVFGYFHVFFMKKPRQYLLFPCDLLPTGLITGTV